MSLMIDALKKAQQLRLKESQGAPLPKHSPESKKSLRDLGKRWIIIGVGLACLVVFTLIYWRLISPPATPTPIQTTTHIKKKPSASLVEKKPQEPSKDMMGLPKDVLSLPKEISNAQKVIPSPDFIEGPKAVSSVSKDIVSLQKDIPSLPKDIPSLPKDVLSLSKDPQIEKSPPKVEPSIKGKRGETPVKQMAIPPSPASLKEKAPAKSIEVKREGEKDRPLASEILTNFNLGVQFYNQREFLKAIQAYQKLIELDPTYIEAYNNLGIIYQEIGDFDRAFKAYQKAIEINPQYEKGYNNLGILFYLKGRNEEALEAFQKALAINPNNIESHINLGVVFKKQGQLDKAIESYQKALDINPLHRETHYNIALLYEQLENVELAIGHYQQFIKLSSPSHSDLVSKVQRHLDDLMKARKDK